MEETISWSEANNMESKLGSNIQTEVFPVKVDKLPRLYAYRLDAKGDIVGASERSRSGVSASFTGKSSPTASFLFQ